MRKLLIAILSILCLHAFAGAQAQAESGTLHGAAFQIEIPANWNHKLFLLCHGYAMEGGLSGEDKKAAKPFLEAGYAVAQSGYSATGWAVKEGAEDTEDLRKYFVAKYGAPTETLVAGDSMGGLITVMLMERAPHEYAAGLSFCGALDSSLPMIKHHVFDVCVVFDYYFPGRYPELDKPPGQPQFSKLEVAKIAAELALKPDADKLLKGMVGANSTVELAGVIEFWTYLLEELHQRAGGNGFDNRNTIYTGSSDDMALNAGAHRYPADQPAVEYLKAYYTPTGNLAGPLLALHTIHDAVVQPFVPDDYNLAVERAGRERLFAQQVVDESGHCKFKPEETAAAIAELTKWEGAGERPSAGPMPKPH